MSNLIKLNNEVSTTQRLENMMKELLTINVDVSKKVDGLDDRINGVEKRMDRMENDVQLTTARRNTVRRAVHAQVLRVLELPERKADWTPEHYAVSEAYSGIFHQRCYVEVSSFGHLARPYGDTTQRNFLPAIRDVEAWTPANGINGLKAEADAARKARAKLKCVS